MAVQLSDTFVLTVTSVNDLPTISDIGDQAISEDGNTGDLAFTVGDVETPVANLTLSGSSDNLALVPNGNITFGGAGPPGLSGSPRWPMSSEVPRSP